METSALRKQLEAEGVQTRQDKYAAASVALTSDAQPILIPCLASDCAVPLPGTSHALWAAK